MTKKTMEQQNKYGHLLDKYLDNVHRKFSSRQECEEEARRKYGNLVNHMKSDNKIYDDIVSVGDMRRRIRQQREDVYEQENVRRQERIERGVLLNPFAKGGLGNAVFFAEMGLCFAVLVE